MENFFFNSATTSASAARERDARQRDECE